ncbi:GNAT family N-acetyltransferase [Novosphingobium piscinae]|uniref:GNAT family N-acetyltransferase n=1 Tax=Novosphingobium piscinae TaxID=1507448 RepID=A0A7X1G2K1_9SPHN|nr:GNAT family N-acetyltransferase [Novosphingobium piscinae]
MLQAGPYALWPPQADDHAALHALTAPAEMRCFLGNHQPDEADSFARLYRNAGSWALHGYGTFMVREAQSGAFVGHCGVFRSWRGLPGMNDVAEAGWIIGRDWWGRGVASVVMDAVLAWFDQTHGCQRVACMIEQGNVASERLAARLGFVPYHEHTQDSGTVLTLYERLR